MIIEFAVLIKVTADNGSHVYSETEYSVTFVSSAKISWNQFRSLALCRPITSGGSGLPEPENPTGFGPFLETRCYPNPNFFDFNKPETTRTRCFWDFLSPKIPEPELQTRGYPTGLETLKIALKSPWNCPKNPRNWPRNDPKSCKVEVASRHSSVLSLEFDQISKPIWY